VARSAALAAMAAVIALSVRAGVELVYAVLRGMLAFLAVQWLLGAAADVLELAFKPSPPHRPGLATQPQPEPTEREP
jgi:hypothetical protein